MSDLSCLWKVHTFPLIVVNQSASFCLWIQRWNSSFVSAWADVLETTRLIREDEQSSRTRAKRAAPTNCIIFWDCCLLALFSIVGEKRRLAFSTFHFFMYKKKITFGIVQWKWRAAESLWAEKSTENPFFPKVPPPAYWSQVYLMLGFN